PPPPTPPISTHSLHDALPISLVEISRTGLARGKGPGESTVLVRFLGRQEPVRLAFVPARPEFKWQKVAANNYIDEAIFAKLKLLDRKSTRLNSSHEWISYAVF